MPNNSLLFTSTSYLPAIGGAQLHTHRLARQLSEQHGYTVQVISMWDEQRTDWLLGTTLLAPQSSKNYTVDGIPVRRITLSRAERWRIWPAVLGYYAFKQQAIDKIATPLINKIKPQAMGYQLIQNSRIGREPLSFASLRVARQLNIPFVFVPYHHPRWVGWNYREYLALYRQADALIALTHVEKETLVELGVAAERVFVTGNGPHLAAQGHGAAFRARHGLGPDTPLILFLGQKYRYKGVEAVVAAAQAVWQQWPEARFAFIGPRTRFSKKLFARHADDPRLIERGTVDLQEKSDALAACTLLCVPSSQESFGGVYVEAWWFGKPVIGADIPAVREVITSGVDGYVLPQTPTAIAARINHLLAEPEHAALLGQAGRRKAERLYNWPALAEKTHRVYQTVLGRP